MPPITADHREQKSGVIEALEQLTDQPVEVVTLAVGDYRINELIFERKTLRDFAASLADGRLFRQAIRLAAGPARGVIILEGSSADLQAVNMRREALQGALVTLSLVLGLPVLRSFSPKETAQLMWMAAQQVTRLDRKPIAKKGKRKGGKAHWQMEVLQSFPGIGPEKAERLLEHFGSLKGIFAADAAEWQQVEGIGPKMAEKMEWVLEG